MVATRIGASSRIVTVIVAAALALGVSACGDDDSGSDADRQDGDRREIEALIVKVAKTMREGDGEVGCPLMAKQTRRGFAAFRDEKSGDCALGFKRVHAAGGFTEDLRPTIARIRIDGARAEVVARPQEGQQPPVARLVKEDGEWRLRYWFTN